MTGRAGLPKQPEIVENYRDFAPPPRFRSLVEDLLETVPPEFLSGIATVVLTNGAALGRNQRRQKIWNRNRKERLARALGTYHQATRNSGAAIWLYADNIVKFAGPTIFRVPLIRYFPVEDVLYHEIGHHIHKVHRPVYKGPEDVADEWRTRLEARFFRKHYWYLWPVVCIAWPFLKCRQLIVWAGRRIRKRAQAQ